MAVTRALLAAREQTSADRARQPAPLVAVADTATAHGGLAEPEASCETGPPTPSDPKGR